MLFHVEMVIQIPPDADAERIAALSAQEKEIALDLQRKGAWKAIWRIVGKRANISIFDVDSAEELHAILSGLPLFPYMDITVRPICHHPATLKEGA